MSESIGDLIRKLRSDNSSKPTEELQRKPPVISKKDELPDDLSEELKQEEDKDEEEPTIDLRYKNEEKPIENIDVSSLMNQEIELLQNNGVFRRELLSILQAINKNLSVLSKFLETPLK